MGSNLEQIRRVCTARLGQACAQVRLASTRASMAVEIGHDTIQLSDEQRSQIASSSAMSQVIALAQVAAKNPDGLPPIRAANLACEFFEANGMAYRLLERDAMDSSPSNGGTIPSHIALWTAPSIDTTSSPLGTDSLIGVDRAGLIDAATRFYLSGLRCVWFEKMLVEALVAAETFATALELKRNPTSWLGSGNFFRHLVWNWAYESSKGRSPRFEFTVSIANGAVGFLKLIFIAGLGLYSAHRLEESHTISGWAGLIVAGWVGLNMLGSFLTKRIVAWSRNRTQAAFAHLNASPLIATMRAMLQAYSAVSAVTTSPALAKSLITEAAIQGARFDPIIVSFLDRAIENREFAWSSLRATGASDVEDEPDDTEFGSLDAEIG